jgi:adenine-specific DNA-methyltransferase
MRKLGAYYTPTKVSLPMVKWAVRNSNDVVIDPTFGGCSFIDSAIKTLRSFGTIDTTDHLYGSDVDPIAFEYLKKLLPNYLSTRFFDLDFFKADFDVSFDAIVGNPPYIKHDNIPENSLISAKSAVANLSLFQTLSRPNYWVYFIVHCASLLKEGGRMAFVLPQSITHAKYSENLLSYMTSIFESIDIYPIRDQIFSNTNESTVIALFNNYSSKLHRGVVYVHDSINSIDISKTLKTHGKIQESERLSHKASESEALSALQKLSSEYSIYPLSNYFVVKIGVVTGFKKYFIIDRNRAVELNINSRYLKPVFSNASDLDELIVSKTAEARLPFLLGIPDSYIMEQIGSDAALDTYLKSAPLEVKETAHAKGRKPWYSVRSVYVPDAFIKNVVRNQSFIYANYSQATCTNNIIRLSKIRDIDVRVLSLFSTTSLFQLSALINAKAYGRNALKLEPAGINKILLPYKKLSEDEITEAVECFSECAKSQSMFRMDLLLLNKYLGMSKEEIIDIRRRLQEIQLLRNIS